MGDGDAFPHDGRDGPLALEHRVDVRRVDGLDIDEELAGLPDGVLGPVGGCVELNGSQLEQLA